MPDAEIEVIRQILSANPRPAELIERRKRLDALGGQYPLPTDVRLEAADANGVSGEWTMTPEANPANVILYLHGGGYTTGSLQSHRHMVAQAGREARARTIALDYRLAPEHPFPAAVEDAVAGDSAGGGLTVALLVSLRDAGLPLPACAWCSSPWVDLEGAGGSMTAKAAVDPMVQPPYLIELAATYLHGADPRTPLAAPLYADLRGLPPMLIQVGSAETLLDDAVRLAGVAGAADVRVRLEVWPDMIHVWHMFAPRLHAATEALDAIGSWLTERWA